MPHQDGPTADDWPDEHIAQQTTNGAGHGRNPRRAHYHERGLNTGVRVMDDGRLDIKIRERKPWVSKIIKHLQQQPEPLREERKPSVCLIEEGKPPCALKLNIVIQVVGSRGDVQPFVALGKVLKSHGHRVRLATHLAFRESIEHAGLEFFDIGGDPAELMAFMVRNPGLMPHMSTLRSGAIPRRRREMKAIFSGCWRSCYETGDGTGMHHIPDDPWSETADYRTMPFVADAIIANPPTFVHLSCAEKLGIPLNMMFTMPWSATQSFPHPLATIRTKNTKPSAANFASYAIVEILMWEGLGDLINSFRKRDLGLDPLDAIRAPSIAHRLRIPYTYLWSPALLPKPGDWGDNIDIVGFSFLSTASDYTPPDDLANFLESGPPPIYVGFGSIVVDNPGSLTKKVFQAIRESGQRAVVSKGWGNLGADEDEIPENIFMIDKCPHDWLFQHVSCVIHHGGAGTTAAGLVLGRPTIIIPFFGDQPFWGSIVARAGAGPLPIPHKQLTAEKLTKAIKQALEPETLEKAKEIGRDMRKERGVQNAAASFYQHLDVQTMRCSLCPNRPAVWWVKHSHIKLSTFAATVLVETGLISPRNVVLYRSREYDTNRDPRGPLSAGAEILYGIVSGFVTSIAEAPSGMRGIFSTTHERRLHHKHDWKKELRPSYLDKSSFHRHRRGRTETSLDSGVGTDVIPNGDNQRSVTADQNQYENGEREQPSYNENSRDSIESDEAYHSAGEDINRDQAIPDRQQNLNGATNSPSGGESSSPHTSSSDTETFDTTDDDMGAELDLERTITRLRMREMSHTKEILAETSYHSARATKHIANWLIKLPTDLTLSLTKGFHNAPKLYHDTLVEDSPRVLGVRSGFRAAGTEFTHGFYNGITGLVTQPVVGIEKSGAKGLLTGIGKGVGGVFLKPTAGLWGLAGYPLEGMHKSLRNSLSKSKTKDILASRMQQGIEEMCAATTQERSAVIQKWHELQRAGLGHMSEREHEHGHHGS
ncbi:putative UDP-glucose,sterol transferase [Aspergillus neoniger CBS 115656]|uniref:UDP-Glycosyltransferase/glycogen phosphorylase n=1 Tax=Aspergillus neoniger (strain CBS 115656) TaxID=1448310 RepID=A0A318YTP3_ASPNB|nr:UDP-Glycosyltransferase/glycogen phosphorylase [Aspergillus neoniger CBS 115656]PYH38101.1 UDP-Glycosyltransferase/glycogen phosphorylase [Aspergillus neoniger CBS 115656]